MIVEVTGRMGRFRVRELSSGRARIRLAGENSMSSLAYPSPQDIFQMQYSSVRRDEVVGVLLSFFLGCFGIHHFYLGRTGLGILYCCFCWTGIPAILGLIECFVMPSRVRDYNAFQASAIAASLGISVPAYAQYPGWVAPGYGYAGPGFSAPVPDPDAPSAPMVACAACGQVNNAAARFCSGCGRGLG
jgi:TM2 domain-containing membrane protein YozV